MSLSLILALMGLAMGVIDTTANVCVLKTFGVDVTPFLQVRVTLEKTIIQALHFFYGLGACVAPLLLEPFLLSYDCSAFIENNAERSALEQLIDSEQQNGTDKFFKNSFKFFSDSAAVFASLDDVRQSLTLTRAIVVLVLVQVPIIMYLYSLIRKGHRKIGLRLLSKERVFKKTSQRLINNPLIFDRSMNSTD